MKEKIKCIAFIIVGIIVGGIASTIAANVINANQVGYSNDKTNVTNIQDAIDVLYEKINKPENISSIWKYEGVKAIVYLDPTNLSKECNANNSVSITGTKTGCMKWYVYDEDNTTYTMILDHNAVARSYYNYSGTNESIGTRSKEQIKEETGTTVGYNEVGYDLESLTAIYEWQVTVDLPDAYDIVEKIIKRGTWSADNVNNYFFDRNCESVGACSAGENKYGWLFDYMSATNPCTQYGCNVSSSGTQGYWFKNKASATEIHSWGVNTAGKIIRNTVNNAIYGLRPVITVSKSLL